MGTSDAPTASSRMERSIDAVGGAAARRWRVGAAEQQRRRRRRRHPQLSQLAAAHAAAMGGSGARGCAEARNLGARGGAAAAGRRATAATTPPSGLGGWGGLGWEPSAEAEARRELRSAIARRALRRWAAARGGGGGGARGAAVRGAAPAAVATAPRSRSAGRAHAASRYEHALAAASRRCARGAALRRWQRRYAVAAVDADAAVATAEAELLAPGRCGGGGSSSIGDGAPSASATASSWLDLIRHGDRRRAGRAFGVWRSGVGVWRTHALLVAAAGRARLHASRSVAFRALRRAALLATPLRLRSRLSRGLRGLCRGALVLKAAAAVRSAVAKHAGVCAREIRRGRSARGGAGRGRRHHHRRHRDCAERRAAARAALPRCEDGQPLRTPARRANAARPSGGRLRVARRRAVTPRVGRVGAQSPPSPRRAADHATAAAAERRAGSSVGDWRPSPGPRRWRWRRRCSGRRSSAPASCAVLQCGRGAAALALGRRAVLCRTEVLRPRWARWARASAARRIGITACSAARCGGCGSRRRRRRARSLRRATAARPFSGPSAAAAAASPPPRSAAGGSQFCGGAAAGCATISCSTRRARGCGRRSAGGCRRVRKEMAMNGTPGRAKGGGGRLGDPRRRRGRRRPGHAAGAPHVAWRRGRAPRGGGGGGGDARACDPLLSDSRAAECSLPRRRERALENGVWLPAGPPAPARARGDGAPPPLARGDARRAHGPAHRDPPLGRTTHARALGAPRRLRRRTRFPRAPLPAARRRETTRVGR